MEQKHTPTAERTILDLCDEVDFWKERAEYFERLFKEQRDLYIQEQNERLAQSQKGVADALMLAFAVRDNEDGSLSISKENRQELASRFHSLETETERVKL